VSPVQPDAALGTVGTAGEVYVEMGRLGRPYGLRGWSHVESWTESPEALLEYRRWFLKGIDGLRRPAAMQGARVHGSGLVARVDGSETPERAAELAGTIIEVARSDFAAAPPGEYYRDDLLGFSVCNLEGVALGVLRQILDMPANPVMVVEGERERWLPLTNQHLRRIDPVARTIWVDWPEDF
jgi:16S rRNA processing protein RimM